MAGVEIASRARRHRGRAHPRRQQPRRGRRVGQAPRGEPGTTSTARSTPPARSTCPRTARSSTSLPQTYVVDDQDGVKEPLGMSGVRLEVEVHLVTGATTSVRNVVRSVNRAGLQVQDVVLEPLASAEAVISDEEKELGHPPHRPGRRHHRRRALPRRRRLVHGRPAARRRPHLERHRGGAAHADGGRRGAQEAPRLRAHRARARGRDGGRALGGRAQGAPALAADPVRDHPAAGGGDLHAGGARPRRAPGSRTWRRRASWSRAARRSCRACPSSPSRSSTCRCGAACQSGLERARRRGAEPDLRHRGGACALRRARRTARRPSEMDDGSLVQRVGRRMRDWVGELF